MGVLCLSATLYIISWYHKYRHGALLTETLKYKNNQVLSILKIYVILGQRLVNNDVISMVNNMTSMGLVQSAAKAITKLNKKRLQ